MKKDIVWAWVCICFLFVGMTLFGSYMIRTNRWEKFAHKCEVINMHHLTMDILLDNRGGWMLTPKGFYRIKDISLEKWAKMPDRANVVILTEESIKQMQENFGMLKIEEKNYGD